MQIYARDLKRQLTSPAKPLYWVAGDDPFLAQEAGDAIRDFLRKDGFTEREVFSVETSFNWDTFSQLANSLSLFAERRIIELRFKNAKPDEAGKKALERFLEDPGSDTVVLIMAPKLDKAATSTKWFTRLVAEGLFVQVWPLKREELDGWLAARLKQAGIRANGDAVTALAERVEGNLLAAVQDIERLRLLAGDEEPQKTLDAATVLDLVADSSRIDQYSLVDAALAGDAARAQKILSGLRAEGVHPLPVLGALARELDSLLPMLAAKEKGQNVAAITKSARVWGNRIKPVSAALQRLSRAQVWQLLHQARRIDGAVKGLSDANPWDELSLLLLRLSGVGLRRVARPTPARA